MATAAAGAQRLGLSIPTSAASLCRRATKSSWSIAT